MCSSDLKMSTGDLIWRTETVNGTGPGTCSRKGNRFVVGSNNNTLICRSITDGTKLWEVSFPGHVKGRPEWIDNYVYAVCEWGRLKIINADTGEVIKTIRVGKSSHHQFLTVVPEKEMIILTALEMIHAYSKDGKRLWVIRTRGYTETGGILVNNYFLTISRGGYISIIDINTGGKVAWDFIKDMNDILALPAWNGELLAINTLKRGLFVYRTDLL